MSIPSDKFKEIHSAVSKAGRDRWVGFYVRANLHDHAHHCVDEVLTAAGYSLFDDEVEHGEVDDLVAAYEEGFRSSANKHEVAELKKTISKLESYISDHLASTAASSDPRFPEMFAPRIPSMSTKHVTSYDGEILNRRGHSSIILGSPTASVIYVSSFDNIEDEFKIFSSAVRDILIRLHEAGYNYVRFDAHAPVIDSFPTFDW
jgi:hypothetical protein